MRFLPAFAALISVVVAVLSLIRGDWGVVVVSVILCAIAIRAQLLIQHGRPSDPPLHEDL